MRRSRSGLVALAIVTALTAVRCAGAPSHLKQVHAANTVTSTPPVILYARPDSVWVPYGGVVEVTLCGTGFIPGQPGQNTVHFNGAALRKVPASSDGQRIVFVIPDVISYGGEAPPSRLRAGSYSVSVETTSGTSNAVSIRVYR